MRDECYAGREQGAGEDQQRERAHAAPPVSVSRQRFVSVLDVERLDQILAVVAGRGVSRFGVSIDGPPL